jgi:hypothetical protein
MNSLLQQNRVRTHNRSVIDFKKLISPLEKRSYDKMYGNTNACRATKTASITSEEVYEDEQQYFQSEDSNDDNHDAIINHNIIIDHNSISNEINIIQSTAGVVLIHEPTIQTTVVADFDISSTVMASIQRHHNLQQYQHFLSDPDPDSSLPLFPGAQVTKREFMDQIKTTFIEYHIAGILIHLNILC